ncbi:hypothetical protein FUT79_08970 [Treponema phagedenis]|uniref:hypothetical protein n=1 Tax=Treponema phagedenis TaxID=162 RepID=UPI0011E88B91|nr:hypothetical protein [Treponema phagedenis]QEJ95320.1 hypothetical protein FUT79_08970 [Treponema phagedenis]
MKKMVLILGAVICVLGLFGCQTNKTADVIIKNNSSYDAVVALRNFKEDSKKIVGDVIFPLKKGESIVVTMYDDKHIKLASINRHSLKKISQNEYQILDSVAMLFKVYNKTNEDVVLFDQNNLIDKLTIARDEEKEISVFNSAQLQLKAMTANDNIILKPELQERSIIIHY